MKDSVNDFFAHILVSSNRPFTMKKALTILFWLVGVVSSLAQAPTIVRGPYLNSVSSTSAVIRWRTEQPTDSKVSLFLDPARPDQQLETSDSKLVVDHEVLVSGLMPATKYFYSVGVTTDKGTLYPEQYFKTAPVVGSTPPIRIWALGDFGNSSKNQLDCRDAVIKATADHRPDVWIWLGDNAYNIGLDEEYQRHVFRVYQESFFKNTSLYPSPGNHDYGRAKHDPTDIAYYKIFTMPKNGEAGGIPSGSEAYYSVDYGNVHIISLDSQGELDGGYRIYDTLSRQIEWLKKDLSANRLPWTIVYFHHPPYTKGSHNSDTEAELVKIRENLLRIIERFNVDLVLCGHSHVYERTHPLRGHYGEAKTFDPKKHVIEQKDSPNKYRVGKKGQGVIYIVSGSGGQVGGAEEDYPLKAATYYNNTVGGSLLLDFDDNKLSAKWICADGEMRDQFWITKEK
jgi:acid phosphatase type 7